MRIGIFGGAFDPVHRGHTEAAQIASRELNLDVLFVLPTATPPHKKPYAGDAHRLNMARGAFTGEKMTVSDVEFTFPAPSYTVRTLKYFRQKYPDDELFFVIGGDSLADFSKWESPLVIMSLAVIAVVKRRGSKGAHKKAEGPGERFGGEVRVLKGIPREVSSSRVRTDVLFSKPTPDLLPATVEYIQKNRLYREGEESVERLRSTLSPQRFAHTYNTVIKGTELCKKAGTDACKTLTACLLHDCAKEAPYAEYERYGLTGLSPAVRHAFLGAEIARRDYGVADEDVLNAIRYHTTGRAGMSTLEKLVYLADCIEDGRTNADCALIRAELDKNGFEAAFRLAVAASHRRLTDDADIRTRQAYEYYFPRVE